MKTKPKVKNRSTFLGNLARQTPESFRMWEQLLHKGNFARVVELGTWEGGLSLYFALFCIENKMEFYTFDHIGYLPTTLKKLINFDKYWVKLDIFKNFEFIGNLIKKSGRTLLFCDGGDKAREFNTLAKYLKVGDVIGAHDWGFEILQSDVNKVCKEFNLQILKVIQDQEIKTNIQLFEKNHGK